MASAKPTLVAALRQQTRALGRVYTGDTGFLLREDPDELVSPDVAFVRHERLPPPAERISYLRVVPDLAVEIRSPNDAEAEVRAKLSLYLEVGVPLVWIVDPQKQTVEELRASASGLGDSRLIAVLVMCWRVANCCPAFGSHLPTFSSDGSDLR